MKMYVQSFNKKVEAEQFVNSHNIKKENIVNFFEESTGLFTLAYYAE